jgi:hypothetical protein
LRWIEKWENLTKWTEKWGRKLQLRGPENGVQAFKIDKLTTTTTTTICYFTSKACICPLKPLDLLNIFFISYTYTFEGLFL